MCKESLRGQKKVLKRKIKIRMKYQMENMRSGKVGIIMTHLCNYHHGNANLKIDVENK